VDVVVIVTTPFPIETIRSSVSWSPGSNEIVVGAVTRTSQCPVAQGARSVLTGEGDGLVVTVGATAVVEVVGLWTLGPGAAGTDVHPVSANAAPVVTSVRCLMRYIEADACGTGPVQVILSRITRPSA
jgi:hypothetical protein